MNGFYKVTKSLKDKLTDNGFRVVTIGDTYKVDIARQTIFPYCHIIPGASTQSGQVTTWELELIGMDIVDINKQDIREQEEPFYSTDNMQDVLNDIHNRLAKTIEYYVRGDGARIDFLRIEDDVVFDSFMERYENLLAGWSVGVTITAPTDISIC